MVGTERARLSTQYGVSIFWGMAEGRCVEMLKRVAALSQICPLEPDEIERDAFSVCYAPGQHSKIANDKITIPLMFSTHWNIKLSISHALAQSTKLCLYEARMGELVNETKEMPDHLARTGKVRPDVCSAVCRLACAAPAFSTMVLQWRLQGYTPPSACCYR